MTHVHTAHTRQHTEIHRYHIDTTHDAYNIQLTLMYTHNRYTVHIDIHQTQRYTGNTQRYKTQHTETHITHRYWHITHRNIQQTYNKHTVHRAIHNTEGTHTTQHTRQTCNTCTHNIHHTQCMHRYTTLSHIKLRIQNDRHRDGECLGRNWIYSLVPLAEAPAIPRMCNMCLFCLQTSTRIVTAYYIFNRGDLPSLSLVPLTLSWPQPTGPGVSIWHWQPDHGLDETHSVAWNQDRVGPISLSPWRTRIEKYIREISLFMKYKKGNHLLKKLLPEKPLAVAPVPGLWFCNSARCSRGGLLGCLDGRHPHFLLERFSLG